MNELQENQVSPKVPVTYRTNQPGVVVHACNRSTWEAETGGSVFTASLSYLVRPSVT